MIPACSVQSSHALGCPSYVAPPAAPYSSDSSSVGRVRQAALSMLADQAEVSTDLSAAKLFGAACVPLSGNGDFDLSQSSGFTVQLQSGTFQAPKETPIASQVPRSAYSFVYTPGTIYVHLPTSQAGQLPAGRDWLEAPIGGTAGLTASEDTIPFATQVLYVNPRMVMEELATSVNSAQRIQAEGSGPTASTTFDVSIDLLRASSSFSGPYALQYRSILLPIVQTSLPSPTTQAPTTQAPTTQAPTTQAPTTQAPTTQAPTTQAPTTQAPTSQPNSPQNPWLFSTSSPANAVLVPLTMTLKVVLASNGNINQISFDPPAANLGLVTMNLSHVRKSDMSNGSGTAPPAKPGARSNFSLPIPRASQTVDFHNVIKNSANEGTESVGS
ncbi:MAG TPA: hypothetical protein VMU77_03055 [Acidimicrobiales bacterium]|nr:hypothetical protein [Acidimicrobiales bacterium]